MTKKNWTEVEKDILTEMYANSSTGELAARFGCTVGAVYGMAFQLGLKKDRDYIASVARKWMSDPNHPFHQTAFKKGNIPHSKGRKQTEYMSPECIERCKKTCFKKGNISHNHRHLGSERINKEGYIEVKIAEPGTWKLKHRLTWEYHHGSIPSGANVQFRDGNRQNCDIDNLYVIAREEQMIKNSGSINMSEGMVAVWLSGGRGKNRDEVEMFKQDRALLELKRNQLILSRIINQLEYEKNQY